MLNLEEAFKKLSFHQLRMRWEEYKRLPANDRDAMRTYVVVAALFVAALTMVASGLLSHKTPTGLSDSDRLGMMILTGQASCK